MKIVKSKYVAMKAIGKCKMILSGLPAVRLATGDIAKHDEHGVSLFTTAGDRIVPVPDLPHNTQMGLLK